MSPPFFGDISKDINDLLSKDFYHGTPANIVLNTVAANGTKFNINAKKPTKENALLAGVEAKLTDKPTGLTVVQGWDNQNKLTTKLEFASLLPGLNSDLSMTCVPQGPKTAKVNASFTQPFFAAKGAFDILKPSFVGNLTLAHEGTVGGCEFKYDITNGTISAYAVALAYKARDYTVGVSINESQLTSASFFQRVSDVLQVGAKATMNPKLGSNVAVEVATRYLPDPTSQVKGKISDAGELTLSYKQALRAGVTLGVGASMNVLKLDEPVSKLGWSLTFDA